MASRRNGGGDPGVSVAPHAPDRLVLCHLPGLWLLAAKVGDHVLDLAALRDDAPPPPTRGDIYLGRIKRADPKLGAAFVALGAEPGTGDGFLPAAEARYGPVWRGLSPTPRPAGSGIGALAPEGCLLPVQVTRPGLPEDGKGPRVTTRLRLAGRWLVLTPAEPGLRWPADLARLEQGAVLGRLQALLQPLLAPGEGMMLRHGAATASPEALRAEWERLRARWQPLAAWAQRKTPGPLLRESTPLAALLQPWLGQPGLQRIVLDDAGAGTTLQAWLQDSWPSDTPAPALQRPLAPGAEGSSLFENEGIGAALEAALAAEIPLPGGGSLALTPARALTAIDVDSGSHAQTLAQGSTAGQVALAVNRAAAKEIARQLRLRQIGGIVVVDFIDMDSARDREAVRTALQEATAADPAPVQIGGWSRLGLLELSRRREGLSLAASLTHACPACQGGGRLWDPLLVLLPAWRQLEQLLLRHPTARPVLTLAPGLVAALGGDLPPLLRDSLPVPIRLQSAEEAAWPWERVEISLADLPTKGTAGAKGG